MTYDNTDTNADGAIDAPIDNETVDTEVLNNAQVPDPADDVAGIQAAHDALPSDGGLIVLKSGTYLSEATYANRSSTELDISKPNVTLLGPRNAEIKVKDGVTPSDEGAPMINWSGDYGTVRGITLNGNIQNNGGFNSTTGQYDGHNITGSSYAFRFINVKSINSTGDGIEHGADDVLVHGCHFEDNEEQDVHIQGGASNMVIAENTMIGCRNNGAINTFGSGSTLVEGHKIINNQIINPTTQAIYLGGGETYQNIEIRGNRISGSTLQGIYTPGDTATFDSITIADNHIFDCDSSAIVLNSDGASTDIRLIDNEIEDNASTGTQHVNLRLGGSRIKVAGNTIKGGNGDGLQVRPFGSDVEDLVIRDNQIIDNNRGDNGANGLIFNTPDAAGVVNARVRENEIYTTSAPHYFAGIFPVSGNYTDVEVSENVFRNYTNSAIANPTRFSAIYENTPMVPHDSAPSAPFVGQRALASATWDPDGDGNGEIVVYDGAAWQEQTDMPNQ